MLRTMQIYMNCVMFLKELARESSTNARKYCRLSFCAVLRFKVGLLAPFSFPSTSTSTAYDGKHECASQNHDQAEANIGLLERETSRPRSHEHFSNTEGDIDIVFTHIAMRRPSLNFTTPTPSEIENFKQKDVVCAFTCCKDPSGQRGGSSLAQLSYNAPVLYQMPYRLTAFLR